MLHSVTWPSVCTYQDVINNHVAYVLKNYGPEALVCFDGYSTMILRCVVFLTGVHFSFIRIFFMRITEAQISKC